MNAELLYEALSDGNSLAQLNEYDLKRLVSAHPYFSIAQLLLTKKFRQADNKESYHQQREHVQAFYRNPWWLYYQLELSGQSAHHAYAYVHASPYQPAAMGTAPATAGAETGAGTASPEMEPEATEIIPFSPDNAGSSLGQETEQLPAEPRHHLASTEEEVHDQPQTAARRPFVPWPGMEESVEAPTLPDIGAVTENESHQAETSPTETQPEIPKPFLPYMVRVAMGEENNIPAAAISPEPAKSAAVQDSVAAEKEALKAEYLAEPEDLPLEEEDESMAMPGIIQPDAPGGFPSGEPAPFPFSITPLTHDFTFEPLHTVDYFASQGIKLELEENPTDTLSRHLKSFTEWLKTMKRISPLDTREDLDAATEAEIQLLASSANRQKEVVVTESMAHVWVLQGKVHKAIEVYHKLSLQHPEKRAYFASKIDQLNRL